MTLYLNPATYLDGPESYAYIEDDNGHVADHDHERDAIAHALKLSGTFSDVYRIYDQGGNVQAIVYQGRIYKAV